MKLLTRSMASFSSCVTGMDTVPGGPWGMGTLPPPTSVPASTPEPVPDGSFKNLKNSS